jgi:hypothetical protein
MSRKLGPILFAAVLLAAGSYLSTPIRASAYTWPVSCPGGGIRYFYDLATNHFTPLADLSLTTTTESIGLYEGSGSEAQGIIANTSGTALASSSWESVSIGGGADTSFSWSGIDLVASTTYLFYYETNGTGHMLNTIDGGSCPVDFYGPTSGPTISFYFPTNGTTTTPFNFWEIAFDGFPTSTAYDGTIRIYYGAAGSSTTYEDPGYFSNLGAPAGGITYPRAAGELWIPGDPVPKNWGAWATLTPDNTSTGPIDTGATIFFDIFPVGATSSSPPTTTNCNYTSSSILFDPVGNIQQGVCQALIYLFIPGQAQQTDLVGHFNALIAAVQKKPPFGYFSGAINAFATIGSGSSTIYVWSSQLVSAFSVILDPIDLAFAALVAILWLLWLLRKVENLHRF